MINKLYIVGKDIAIFIMTNYISWPTLIQNTIVESLLCASVGYFFILLIQLYNIMIFLPFIPITVLLAAIHFYIKSQSSDIRFTKVSTESQSTEIPNSVLLVESTQELPSKESLNIDLKSVTHIMPDNSILVVNDEGTGSNLQSEEIVFDEDENNEQYVFEDDDEQYCYDDDELLLFEEDESFFDEPSLDLIVDENDTMIQ